MKAKRTETISVRITPDQLAYLQKKAEEQDRTISYIVQKIIEAHIQKETAPD